MTKLTNAILETTRALPEGAAISAKELLHLGNRAAVDQALSRLARRGELLRVSRGVYVRPVEGRFGTRPPSAESVVAGIARLTGESIGTTGAAAANKLGLTNQVPVRMVYVTSGPSRRLTLGANEIELKHVPEWQVALTDRPAGDAIRALAWAGQRGARKALEAVRRKLAPEELEALSKQRSRLPTWLAQEVSALALHA